MTRSPSRRCLRLTNDFCLEVEKTHKGGSIFFQDRYYKVLHKGRWGETIDNKKQKTYVVGNGIAIYRYEIFKQHETYKKYFTLVKRTYPKYAYQAELVGCEWEYKKSRSKLRKEPRFRIPDYSGK